MKTSRNIVVYGDGRPHASAAVEMCEHKGVGHPDTVTDAVCEAVALDLVRAYETTYGGAMHFNVDKGLLVGGRSEPRFGGGRILQKPKLLVCGRASAPDERIRLPELVTGAAARWLDGHLAAGSSLFELSSEVRQGSANLAQIFRRSEVRANDTSFGVGYAPFSELETKVLALSRTLVAPEIRVQCPAAGQDFKIMGLRQGRVFTFTVALAFIDRFVLDLDGYFSGKEHILQVLRACLDPDDQVKLNRLDDPDATDERGIYLTVTGLSAEMGDDGQVGRGNRVNGLITPGRAMSLEAAAGKNPYAHVGKIYNVLAHRLALTICARIPEVKEVTVRLLSAIGLLLDEPQSAAVEIAGEASTTLREAVAAVVDAEFDDMAAFLAELSSGRLQVY